MTFGFASTVDALSWIVALVLGTKVAVTLFVLIVNKQMRDQPGWGSTLWWVTKITPLIAVPCLFAIGSLRGDTSLTRLALAAALFVVVAVPLKVRQRRIRLAARAGAAPAVSGQAASGAARPFVT